ncbi:Quinol monooxygenase YgiN [Nocardioides scoriae]|uniref:Quinol monooxygenase YgiN n=1 Tax=Nocardioides scoriae TaxID=642780 RepID=A0A1H1QLW7_9ACTN|nr:Quinol monooxygenase YgiN [Nocardioides scoriae]
MRTILIEPENHCQTERRTVRSVLVVNRFRVDEDDAEAFRRDLEAAHAVMAAQRGYESGDLGRNVDDPTLWTMVTRWRDVGSYRRCLSSYDVKVGAVPLLSRALDEPSAYEPLDGELNRWEARERG